MAALAYQDIDHTGGAVTLAAAAGGGDTATPDAKGFLWVKNAAAGGTITVTIAVAGTTFGQANADVAVSIPDGEERLIGPLVPELTGADTFGVVLIAYSPNVTGVTVAAVRLSNPPPDLP